MGNCLAMHWCWLHWQHYKVFKCTYVWHIYIYMHPYYHLCTVRRQKHRQGCISTQCLHPNSAHFYDADVTTVREVLPQFTGSWSGISEMTIWCTSHTAPLPLPLYSVSHRQLACPVFICRVTLTTEECRWRNQENRRRQDRLISVDLAATYWVSHC